MLAAQASPPVPDFESALGGREGICFDVLKRHLKQFKSDSVFMSPLKLSTQERELSGRFAL
jgi:hypothetical protein